MVEGVTKGFQKTLEIVGRRLQGGDAALRAAALARLLAPDRVQGARGVKLKAPNPTTVIIDGANKEIVGQVAAEIRSLRPPEPYKGKGVKYQGEVVRRKAGKAGGK